MIKEIKKYYFCIPFDRYLNLSEKLKLYSICEGEEWFVKYDADDEYYCPDEKQIESPTFHSKEACMRAYNKVKEWMEEGL